MKVLFVFVALVSAVLAVKVEDVKFFAYTARQSVTPVQVRLGEFGLIDIDPTQDVKILCHGYLDDHNSYWIEPMKSAYMSVGVTNVISVDWSAHAMGLYSASTKNAKGIAQFIADLIVDMSTTHNIPLSRFHLIGHSLGSHIFGFAGKRVFAATGKKVGRISALDPAGPSFNGNKEADRLTADDATFVDAMHTDTTLAGYKKAIGHVDYWPNGGSSQPGCGALSNCSHLRAPEYFYWSIINRQFTAWQCGSKADHNNGKCTNNRKTEMGENVDRTVTGDFYLNTVKEEPFACNC